MPLGHFAAGRWQRGPGGPLPEMFIVGEGLSRGPADVLATLLHEGAHGAAAIRKIQDTSRQGRWNNARYRAIAAELGLDVAQAPRIGWSATTVPAATAARYAAEFDDLAAALTAWRHPEHRGGRASSKNGTAARCPCGRRIRVAGPSWTPARSSAGSAAATSPRRVVARVPHGLHPAILGRRKRGESIRTIAAGVKVSVGVVHKTLIDAQQEQQL